MKIEHIAIYVNNLEAARNFFVKYFNAKPNDGYEVVSGPRTTGDGYYESCVVGVEGNQIEITI